MREAGGWRRRPITRWAAQVGLFSERTATPPQPHIPVHVAHSSPTRPKSQKRRPAYSVPRPSVRRCSERFGEPLYLCRPKSDWRRRPISRWAAQVGLFSERTATPPQPHNLISQCTSPTALPHGPNPKSVVLPTACQDQAFDGAQNGSENRSTCAAQKATGGAEIRCLDGGGRPSYLFEPELRDQEIKGCPGNRTILGLSP